MSDWRPAATDALAAAVARDDSRLGCLLTEAGEHLARLLATRPPETVAALAVPVAVHRCLTGAALPPDGLLASAAATYLALDVLDDRMDGDAPGFWTDRGDPEIMVGVQVLLVTATQVVGEGTDPQRAARMTRLYREMIAVVADGQLRSGEPLTASTTPAEVDSRIGARSGAMLAGFAELAALAAEGSRSDVDAARAFGYELAVARQHLNDVTELVSERTTDLRNRTATMATALALQRLPIERRGPWSSDCGVRLRTRRIVAGWWPRTWRLPSARSAR